jgi:hypothetical protein
MRPTVSRAAALKGSLLYQFLINFSSFLERKVELEFELRKQRR